MAITVISLCASCSQNERPAVHYPTWQVAVTAGAVTRGWLPNSIPLSATNISERHDIDTNAGAFRFFSSKSDLQAMTTQLEQVRESEFDKIGPLLQGTPDWWPSLLRKGRINEFVVREGFKIYQKQTLPTQLGGVKIWYFAINASNGVGFGWHNSE